MKKTFIMLAAGLVLHQMAIAQTPLPYSTGFDTNPPAGWQVFRKGATVVFSEWEQTGTNAYTAPFSLSHDYPVGGTSATDDWYVSPAFSFAAGGKIDSVRHYFSGFGVPQSGDTVAIYLLKGSADPAAATAKTLLYDFRDTKYANDNTWRKATNITIPITPGSSYIAFRYKTIVNWLDVKFDNLRLSGNATGVGEIYKAGAHFTTLPNPVADRLNIRTSEAFERVQLYDMTGRKVMAMTYQPVLNMETLPAGTYVLELVDKYEQKGRTLIVKQ